MTTTVAPEILRQQKDELDKQRALAHRLAIFKPFLDKPDVQEVAVNMPGSVELWTNGIWKHVAVPELTLAMLEQIGKALANYTKKTFNETSTSLSTHLPTGERVEMTHPPTCPSNTRYLNIRKHGSSARSHEELIGMGYYKDTRHQMSFRLTKEERDRIFPHMDEDDQKLWNLATEGKWKEFIELAIDGYKNIIVSGKTGSGKTSYLRSLIELIDVFERIVTAEDTPEMPLPNHPNNNALFYKRDGSNPLGATIDQVLASVMRKSPGRVLLAELRGPEAMTYLGDVLQSGHPGGLSTVHANDARKVYGRLAFLIQKSEAGRNLSRETILQELYSTVDIAIQLTFDTKTNRRYVKSIYYDPMYQYSLLG